MNIDNKELEEIFEKIKQNRKDGIEELYHKYKKAIYGIAFMILKNKDDSEDIVQTIFTKIFELEKSKLPSNNYASWIYSITKNETINYIKKKKSNISFDKIYEIQDDNQLNDVINNLEFNRLISKLNNEEKEILSLKIISGFSFEEISKMLNKPTGTVKWKYYKSIYALKTLLGNFTMFLLLFIAGIKVLSLKKDNKKENLAIQEEKNTIISEENTLQSESKSYNDKNTTQEGTRQDINSENITQNLTLNNNIENTLYNSEENIITNTIHEENNSEIYQSNVGYAFFGTSIIFFIIFIYFLIKHQLKPLIKLSK